MKFNDFEGWLQLSLSPGDGGRSDINCHLYRPNLLFILGDEFKTTLGVILIINDIEFHFGDLSLLTMLTPLNDCNFALCK